MRISEFEEITKLYYVSNHFDGIYFSKLMDPRSYSGMNIYMSDEFEKKPYCVTHSHPGDRDEYTFYTNHYKHEGSAVYGVFLSKDYKKQFSGDYELLHVGRGLQYEDLYGVVIKYKDEWRAYIADTYMYVLERQDFESAGEAKEFFLKWIEDKPVIQTIIKTFLDDFNCL